MPDPIVTRRRITADTVQVTTTRTTTDTQNRETTLNNIEAAQSDVDRLTLYIAAQQKVLTDMDAMPIEPLPEPEQ